jgi:hypothetical protein
MTAPLGYCTNVHAGGTWEQTFAQLEKHALEVRRRYAPTRPMGIGIWLSASSARHLIENGKVAWFRDWLGENGLVPFTLNGFPHGDFHQEVVKHRVYLPTWWERDRLDYTLQLIDILHALLPPGEVGSISTLPIAWGNPRPGEEQLAAAGSQLQEAAARMEQLEAETGRKISVCLEPEPGCVFDTSYGLIEFFKRYLLDGPDAERVRRYIRVCYDMCHAAVMFEDQASMLARLQEAGILIGKVQISSAVAVDFGQLSPSDRAAAFAQLSAFNEPRYLHQTVVREAGRSETTFYEDLPLALGRVDEPKGLTSQWRVHFHVPVYLEKFGNLTATQSDVRGCMEAIGRYSDVQHFEVETYAWSVLPEGLRQPTLAAGIAEEMRWVAETFPAVA